MFVACGGCLSGGVGLAVKVVMVIMTSDGFPMCIPRSLSTGEIFLCALMEYKNCACMCYYTCLLEPEWPGGVSQVLKLDRKDCNISLLEQGWYLMHYNVFKGTFDATKVLQFFRKCPS